MNNPFDALTELSILKPRACLSIGLVGILALSSMAMFIEFDNSEDAFFPDNETVRLLDEVEGEYQASLDFIRILARMQDGGWRAQTTGPTSQFWRPYCSMTRI